MPSCPHMWHNMICRTLTAILQCWFSYPSIPPIKSQQNGEKCGFCCRHLLIVFQSFDTNNDHSLFVATVLNPTIRSLSDSNARIILDTIQTHYAVRRHSSFHSSNGMYFCRQLCLVWKRTKINSIIMERFWCKMADFSTS